MKRVHLAYGIPIWLALAGVTSGAEAGEAEQSPASAKERVVAALINASKNDTDKAVRLGPEPETSHLVLEGIEFPLVELPGLKNEVHGGPHVTRNNLTMSPRAPSVN